MNTIQSLIKTTVTGVSKKFTVIAVVLIAFASSAFASPTEVSTKVLSHFNANYAKAKNITWSETANNLTKVTFVENDIRMELFYNKDGDVVSSSKEVDFSELPKRAIKTIAKDYASPGYVVKECVQLTNVDDDTNYYISLEDSKGERTILQISPFGDVSKFVPAVK